jgi:glycosyltransferase involved in cell wall biosynthesis
VVSRISGHVEAVIDGESGLIGDGPAELGALLARLLTDAGLRDQLGDAARRHAARYTWDRTASLTFDVLADEAERRR